MCADRVHAIPERQMIKAFVSVLGVSEEIVDDPMVKWTIDSHFNGERLRCFMAIRMHTDQSLEDHRHLTMTVENILDGYELTPVGKAVIVEAPQRISTYHVFGKDVDQDTYEELMTR